jgi:hypothetical protein
MLKAFRGKEKKDREDDIELSLFVKDSKIPCFSRAPSSTSICTISRCKLSLLLRAELNSPRNELSLELRTLSTCGGR